MEECLSQVRSTANEEGVRVSKYPTPKTSSYAQLVGNRIIRYSLDDK
jgi:hypothetical protein